MTDEDQFDWDNKVSVWRDDDTDADRESKTKLGSLNGPRGQKIRTAVIDALKRGDTSGVVEVDGIVHGYKS